MEAAAKRLHLVTFLGALLACVVVVAWMAGPYLLSLFLGGTMAMLCYPVHQWLREIMGPRASAGAVTGLVLLVVVAPLTGFSFLAVKQGVAVGREMADLREFSPKALTAFLSRSDLVRTAVGDPGEVNARLKSSIKAAGQLTTLAVLKVGKGAPEFLLQLLLVLVAFFFFLVDGERFVEWILGLGVLDRTVQKRLVESFRDTTVSAVLAGLAAAASQAVLIVTGFLALDVPGAFLAGGLTFVFSWIPMLGTVPASLAGLAYLYVQGAPVRMSLMIALALSAGLIDNVIRPLVLKGRADMHPLVGLVAIIGGIQMFGMLGVFIGPVVAAMLLALLRIWPAVGGRFGLVPTGT